MATRHIAGAAGAILILGIVFTLGAGAGRSGLRAELTALPSPTPHVITRTRTVTRTIRVPVVRTITKTVKVPVVHTITKTVVKTITVVATPAPDPTPVGPQTLLDIEGSDNKQTDTFEASGPFQVAWNAQESDGSQGSMLFSVELDNDAGEELDLVANGTASTQDSSVMHADCSEGCYLKVTDLNADWHLVVSQ